MVYMEAQQLPFKVDVCVLGGGQTSASPPLAAFVHLTVWASAQGCLKEGTHS